MNKVTKVELIGNVVVISTEGYLNKDLGEEIQNAAQEHIQNGVNKVLINLERSNIVNSIGVKINKPNPGLNNNPNVPESGLINHSETVLI